MIEAKRKFEFGKSYIHKNLGRVNYTLECAISQSKNGDAWSVFMEHDGEIKELSINLIEAVSTNTH